MSAELLGLAFKAEMGSHVAKLVLLKLVDAAEDDGTHIYPAVATIAAAAQAHERTVQRTLRLFQKIGLLDLVRVSSGRPGDTTQYALNLAKLRHIKDVGWVKATAGTDQGEEEETGGVVPPVENDITADPAAETGGVASLTGGAGATRTGGIESETGGKLSHPTPPKDPLDSEREGARARLSEELAEDEALLAKAIGLHPKGPNSDRSKVDPAFWALTRPERREAVEQLPNWLANVAANGGSQPLGLAKYFAQKLWKELPPAPVKGAVLTDGRMLVGLFSRPWWWLVWRRLAGELGGLQRLRFQFQMANSGQGVTVLPAEMPSRDDETRMAQIATDGRATTAWLRVLRDRGLILRLSIRSPYIWAPSEWPPDDKTKAMELQGANDGQVL
jgi:hypothetical protein